MSIKYFILLFMIFIQLFYVSCKSDNQLLLEACIDEFEYIRYQNPLQSNKLEKLKLKLEQINNNNSTVLYYLSEISQLQNKFQEAYQFISEAYKLSHADSIYQKKEKIKKLIPTQELLITDSYSKNILWMQDDMLILKSHEYSNKKEKHNDADEEPKNIENQNIIEQLIQTGRIEIQKLYDENHYLSAINNTKMLIQLAKDLKEEKYIKKELSQLYQDLAILYAKNNNVVEAITAINKAIELNPSQENKNIKNLLDQK